MTSTLQALEPMLQDGVYVYRDSRAPRFQRVKAQPRASWMNWFSWSVSV